MKIYLLYFSGLTLIILFLSVSAIQAQVIQQEKLYSENGVEVTYQLLDLGTKSIGVPGDLRDFPLYQIRLILQNNTGNRIRFRNHSRVDFMRYARTGSPFSYVGINGNYVYDSGETVMHSSALGFVFDDEKFEEIGSPRYSIAAWYFYEPADNQNEEERESQLTKILDRGQVEQLQEQRRVERERERQRQAELERQRRAEEERRRAEAERQRQIELDRERTAIVGYWETIQQGQRLVYSEYREDGTGMSMVWGTRGEEGAWIEFNYSINGNQITYRETGLWFCDGNNWVEQATETNTENFRITGSRPYREFYSSEEGTTMQERNSRLNLSRGYSCSW